MYGSKCTKSAVRPRRLTPARAAFIHISRCRVYICVPTHLLPHNAASSPPSSPPERSFASSSLGKKASVDIWEESRMGCAIWGEMGVVGRIRWDIDYRFSISLSLYPVTSCQTSSSRSFMPEVSMKVSPPTPASWRILSISCFIASSTSCEIRADQQGGKIKEVRTNGL